MLPHNMQFSTPDCLDLIVAVNWLSVTGSPPPSLVAPAGFNSGDASERQTERSLTALITPVFDSP